MHRWFFSLQFRLIVGFALALALALGSVSLFVGFAAQRDVEQFQQEVDEARSARVQEFVSDYYDYYSEPRPWAGLQPALEKAAALYGWRIVVSNVQGIVVGDSHQGFVGAPVRPRQEERFFPVVNKGSRVGSVEVAPSDSPEIAPEPAVSRLVSSLNHSLLWTGLVAVCTGTLFISLMSRQILAPVRALSDAATRLGRGDLSQRVSTSGRDQIAHLGSTFNSMAEGLERADRQRRSLIADVAHELRTPLSNVQGYIEAIRDGVLQPDNATIDTIYEQVQHLARLMEDLRVLALADAGDLRLNIEPDVLGDLLRRSVEAFRPRTEAKGITVSLEVPDEFPLVEMDRTRIAQVVGNLLENATRHTPEAGTVSVSAQLVSSITARVTVANTGEGIPPEDLPNIFDRFYRTDPSRARATGGVGLGLTIAKQLVETHGGTIRAESTPGKGSRFTFDLPLTRAASNRKYRKHRR